MEIPPDWEDRNGHVGVQYFQALFSMGAWRVLEEIGIDEGWFRRHQRSQFDLEHHVFYRSELHVGDHVSTYNRVLGKSERRFHGMYLVVNDSTEKLAATLEYVTAGIDMGRRRMDSFPDDLSRGLDVLLEKHRALGWDAPVCGTMAP
jgi:acyl-CoA thioester hydrolase